MDEAERTALAQGHFADLIEALGPACEKHRDGPPIVVASGTMVA